MNTSNWLVTTYKILKTYWLTNPFQIVQKIIHSISLRTQFSSLITLYHTQLKYCFIKKYIIINIHRVSKKLCQC